MPSRTSHWLASVTSVRFLCVGHFLCVSSVFQLRCWLHRYSDFMVNEIDTSGTVVHLDGPPAAQVIWLWCVLFKGCCDMVPAFLNHQLDGLVILSYPNLSTNIKYVVVLHSGFPSCYTCFLDIAGAKILMAWAKHLPLQALLSISSCL